jgi:hypothetical protein
MRATPTAHKTTVTVPVAAPGTAPGRRGVRSDVVLREVDALAFEHVAYHRSAGYRDGAFHDTWTVTHRASGLAVDTRLPSRAAARALALYLEGQVQVWPSRDEDGSYGPRGGWTNVDDVRAALLTWRINTVGGYAAR